MSKVEKMTFTAMMVACAFCIAEMMKLIPILQMPQGGSASLSLLPLFILAFYLGPIYGVSGGLVFAVINFFFDGYAFSPWSLIFDYLLAFGLVGLIAGFFSKTALKGFRFHNYFSFVIAIIIACSVRFVMHTISGVLAYETPWAASAIYNAGYTFASMGMCIVVGLACYIPLTKYAIRKFGGEEKALSVE